MAIGDIVKVGFGSMVHGISTVDNIPAFNLDKDPSGAVKADPDGCVYPRAVGGIKGGSIGKIVGEPVKVIRSFVDRQQDRPKALAADIVLLYPVFFDHYQQSAYINQDHIHVISGPQ